jgi:hypothetical protein
MDAVVECKVTRSRLSEGRSAGVEVIEVDNGTLRVLLLPQRGMGIWKVFHGETEFGWRSPVSGPVHPMFVPTQDSSGLGWLEGFGELLCRCGLQSNGPPVFDALGRLAFPLHGRIANLPAEALEIRRDSKTGQLEVGGVVREARFLQFNLCLTSTLTIRAGEAAFTIRDEVANLSPTRTHCQLLYHYNVGLPVLGEGAEVVAPIDELAPRDENAAKGIADWATVGPPVEGFAEQVFFATLHAGVGGATQVLLKGPGGQAAVGLRFNVNELPWFVVWKNLGAARDGYVVGIEPGTNFPNPRPFEIEQGRARALEPGESRCFNVQFDFHADPQKIRNTEQQIDALREGSKPTILRAPRPGWSPHADDALK